MVAWFVMTRGLELAPPTPGEEPCLLSRYISERLLNEG